MFIFLENEVFFGGSSDQLMGLTLLSFLDPKTDSRVLVN